MYCRQLLHCPSFLSYSGEWKTMGRMGRERESSASEEDVCTNDRMVAATGVCHMSVFTPGTLPVSSMGGKLWDEMVVGVEGGKLWDMPDLSSRVESYGTGLAVGRGGSIWDTLAERLRGV